MSWADCPLCRTEFPVLVDQGGYFGKCRCGYTVSGGALKETPVEEPPMETVPSEVRKIHLTVYVQDREHDGIMHGRPTTTMEGVERIITGAIGDVCASIEGRTPWLEWTPRYTLPEEWDQFLGDLEGRGVR